MTASSTTFLVCGEALVDLFYGPGQSGPSLKRSVVGGAPLNLAVGLARLGNSVSLFAGVSTDKLGSEILALLKSEGVNTDLVEFSDSPSMVARVEIDERGHPAYSFPVTNGADRCLRGDKVFMHDASVVVLGSYIAVCHETKETIHRIAEAKREQSVICYDCNVRLSIVPERALWRHALEQLLPLTDVLKVSDEDLEGLFGPKGDYEELAGQFLSAGPSLVLLTRGASGASAYFAQGTVHVPARKVRVVDTVGAGDSFFAAVLAQLADQRLLSRSRLTRLSVAEASDALQHGVAAAALTCSREGARLPTKSEQLAFVKIDI